MAELLGSQSLLSITDDSFKSGYLERMVSAGKMTNSYKLLWLRGVFEEVLDGYNDIPFERIVARMVAAAWYPIIYFRLSFGLQDKMFECVDALRDATRLPNDASKSEIITESLCCSDNKYQLCVLDRCRYVPHLLIRPFYEDEIRDEEKKAGRRLSDTGIKTTIINANRSNANDAPYVFNKEISGLIVDPGWITYFRDNQCIIRGWLDMKLVQYLQARNPSTPAISLKIYPPRTRDLSAATRYWKEALELVPLCEIYSGLPFTNESLISNGGFSIDHFIPWSFVLHDEPWNLIPMFKNSNSSKGDRLPILDNYFDAFANQQFSALMAIRKTGRHKKIIESYLQIVPDLMDYRDNDDCRMAFADNISNIIRPLYQIAINQGFDTWYPAL